MHPMQEILMPLLGGVMIGAAALFLLGLNGRVMGASGIWSGLVRWSDGPRWRLAFVAGSIAAPVLIALAGRPVTIQVEASAPVLVLAGLLVGIGTSLGSGCTSGHGVCGVSRLSPRSIAATAVFIAVGVATVYLLRHVIGGGA